MMRLHRALSVLFFLLAIVTHINAQQPGPLQLASLRPQQELRWHRVSPNSENPDGPVLYQLLLNASGTPGTVPVFDSNPRHLINSPIIVNSGNVAIGGLSINGGTGIITFANGQTFPGNSGGTVTSLSAGAGISLSPSPITITGSISIADGGVTASKIGSGAAPNGQVLVANGSGNASWQMLNSTLTNAWSLGGNTGTGCTTSPCTKFLGTTDNSALEFHVSGARAYRVEPATDGAFTQYGFSPNVVAGFSGNLVAAGAAGATIAGGGANNRLNTVNGSFATVSGGVGNTASGIFSAVAGGQANTASGFASFAAGSAANTNNHVGAFVWADNSSGSDLMASANNQFMARATGGFKFIAGLDGTGNPDPAKTVSVGANSGIITFVPGQTFPASGVPAWLLGGNSGTGCTTSPCSDFLGTIDNTGLEMRVANNRAYRIEPATDTQFGLGFSPNVIAGFSGNLVTGVGTAGATIAGGGAVSNGNTVNASFGTVGGGLQNTAGGNYSDVAGGRENIATGFASTLAGGFNNNVSGNYSSVAGGLNNLASGNYSSVAGGSLNDASGFESTVAGGGANLASGDDSSVAGGNENAARGLAATVAGGFQNTASGRGSFAAGQHANTNNHPGSFVWGDNSTTTDVTASADNQFVARATGGFQFITAVDGSGNPDPAKTVSVTAGRVSLGIYVKSDLPSTPTWDEACTSPSDVAISGGAFVFSGGVLRESRPSVTIVAPGTSGAANAWRVACTDLTSKLDVACSQAYVVCLTHASQ